MGIPQHFSLELPERCLHLIQELWPKVQKVRVPGEPHLGPLTTTFLLAMAAPIISLPYERIKQHLDKPHGGYMDDRPLDEELATEVRRVFGAARFELAPFFTPGAWRFARMPYADENLALHLPYDFADRLGEPEALNAARQMPVSQWAACLRNALAHGGVMYLNRDGHQSYGKETELLAFVSAHYPERDMSRPPERLNVLRIGEPEFREFLTAWVGWLSSSGLSRALAA